MASFLPRTLRRRTALAAAVVGSASLVAPSLQAQARWPEKPIRFIVPFPPGGTVDPLARLIGARLTEALGQQVIVDNRAGASGSIGAAAAAKSQPDGYTFLFVFDTHAVNPALISPLPYDTMRDLEPIMLIILAAVVLVVVIALLVPVIKISQTLG